jgi:hypothetical protein
MLMNGFEDETNDAAIDGNQARVKCQLADRSLETRSFDQRRPIKKIRGRLAGQGRCRDR